MAQVSMLSDEWLSRYRLVENINIRMAIFEGDLDFNLQPHLPGLDPEARCHGIKANSTGYLWLKNEFTFFALSAGFLLTKINIGKTGNQQPPSGVVLVTWLSNIDFFKAENQQIMQKW